MWLYLAITLSTALVIQSAAVLVASVLLQASLGPRCRCRRPRRAGSSLCGARPGLQAAPPVPSAPGVPLPAVDPDGPSLFIALGSSLA